MELEAPVRGVPSALRRARAGLIAALALALAAGAAAQTPRARLVESIPTGMDDLRATQGVAYTGPALRRLVEGAKQTIDLTAMYWNLLPDTGKRGDAEGFDAKQLEAFGADEGSALLQALKDAAKRGVRIRILQAQTNPEAASIVRANKKRASTREIAMPDWYGGGIMHQKIWMFDGRALYLGSANMDWKSLTQVKEIGIVLEDHPVATEDLTRQFEAWWKFADMPVKPVSAFDPRAGIERAVPGWSALVPAAKRLPTPFEAFATPYGWGRPFPLELAGRKGSAFIAAAPPELCPPGRTYDGDGIVRTLLDAKRRVSVSVMDFAPSSLYREDANRVANPVWWPELVDALLTAVVAHGVDARLLISRWAHTSPIILPYLEALQQTANACLAESNSTCGRLEIRIFQVPGWDRTAGRYRDYPGHSRVNHTKYVVTDRRANIGTSNMTWSYFTSTAGASFNTDQPDLVGKLAEIFDRDWTSRYAFPLSAVGD